MRAFLDNLVNKSLVIWFVNVSEYPAFVSERRLNRVSPRTSGESPAFSESCGRPRRTYPDHSELDPSPPASPKRGSIVQFGLNVSRPKSSQIT